VHTYRRSLGCSGSSTRGGWSAQRFCRYGLFWERGLLGNYGANRGAAEANPRGYRYCVGGDASAFIRYIYLPGAWYLLVLFVRLSVEGFWVRDELGELGEEDLREDAFGVGSSVNP